MELEARIIPNAKKFSISLKDGIWKINVPAKAEDGKANRELVKGLEKALGRKVTILQGAKSRTKTLEIEGREDEVTALLCEFASEYSKKVK